MTADNIVLVIATILVMTAIILGALIRPGVRSRLIIWLGGHMTPPHSIDDCALVFWQSLPEHVRNAAARSCKKVAIDPSFRQIVGSNLGREIRRDEAAEWAKLYLKDDGINWRDSDVHLATELYFYLNMRKTK